MIFGPKHYVPILKAKQAETRALKLLAPHLYQHITPLFEITERKGDPAPNLDKHLSLAFNHLNHSVNLFSRCFLDTRELAPDGPTAASEVFKIATSYGIVFTPVTGIYRTQDFEAARAFSTHGLALRVTKEDYDADNLKTNILNFLKEKSLVPENIDLIVDLSKIDHMIKEGVVDLTTKILDEIPEQTRWKTFTIAGCAFPKSMGGIEKHTHRLKDRSEWVAWRDDLYANRQSLTRLPTFSDCAIQYPDGVEGLDFSVIRPAPSVRYTFDTGWVLIKGEGGQRQASHKLQFPVLATRLTVGDLSGMYYGSTHCEGCKSMEDCANGVSKLGSNGVWRRLGTIHHITTTVNSIVSLTWP